MECAYTKLSLATAQYLLSCSADGALRPDVEIYHTQAKAHILMLAAKTIILTVIGICAVCAKTERYLFTRLAKFLILLSARGFVFCAFPRYHACFKPFVET